MIPEGFNIKDYDYNLPQELIAQNPLADRSACRLMYINKNTGEVEHHRFTDLYDFLRPGDLLVVNDSKVIPSMLTGKFLGKNQKAEIYLEKRLSENAFEAYIISKNRKVYRFTNFDFGSGFSGCVTDVLEHGLFVIEFSCYNGSVDDALNKHGKIITPTYSKRH